ncbi:MAG: hypothetical protein R3F17_14680 [Planctomycetota bacterium]
MSEDRTRFYLGDELDENGSLTTRTHVFDEQLGQPHSIPGSYQRQPGDRPQPVHERRQDLCRWSATQRCAHLRLRVEPVQPAGDRLFRLLSGFDGQLLNGLWSVLLYFPSGIMIGRRPRARPVRVVRRRDQQLDISPWAVSLTQISPGGETLTITIDAIAPAVLDLSSPVLAHDLGSGAVTVPLTSWGGNHTARICPPTPAEIAAGVVRTGLQHHRPSVVWTGRWPRARLLTGAASAYDVTMTFSDAMETDTGWVGGVAGGRRHQWHPDPRKPQRQRCPTEDDHSLAANLLVHWPGQLAPVWAPTTSTGHHDPDVAGIQLIRPTPSGIISYWRWYVNNGNSSVDDLTFVEITANGST